MGDAMQTKQVKKKKKVMSLSDFNEGPAQALPEPSKGASNWADADHADDDAYVDRDTAPAASSQAGESNKPAWGGAQKAAPVNLADELAKKPSGDEGRGRGPPPRRDDRDGGDDRRDDRRDDRGGYDRPRDNYRRDDRGDRDDRGGGGGGAFGDRRGPGGGGGGYRDRDDRGPREGGGRYDDRPRRDSPFGDSRRERNDDGGRYERRDRHEDGDRLPSGPRRDYDMPARDPPVIPDHPPFTAYIGNLPYECRDQDIEDFFEGCRIKYPIRLLKDRENDRLKGYGYVEFEDRDSLAKAVERHGGDMRGRHIKVDVATQSDHAKNDKTTGDWRSAERRPMPERRDDRRDDRGDRGDRRGFGGDRRDRDGGGFHRRDDHRDEHRDAPRERPKYNINPDAVKALAEGSAAPAATPAADAPKRASPFGAAKPRDESEVQRKKDEERKARAESDRAERAKREETREKEPARDSAPPPARGGGGDDDRRGWGPSSGKSAFGNKDRDRDHRGGDREGGGRGRGRGGAPREQRDTRPQKDEEGFSSAGKGRGGNARGDDAPAEEKSVDSTANAFANLTTEDE